MPVIRTFPPRGTYVVPFSTYARLNGACSTAIGVLFVVAGFPGLFGHADDRYLWWAVPAILSMLVFLAAVGRWRGAPLLAPGRWLTDRPIATAGHGEAPLDEARLRRRLILETVVWAVIALLVIAGFTTSRPFAYLTGWWSLVYGLVELGASSARILAVQREQGVRFLLRRRPGIGTPDLTT